MHYFVRTFEIVHGEYEMCLFISYFLCIIHYFLRTFEIVHGEYEICN